MPPQDKTERTSSSRIKGRPGGASRSLVLALEAGRPLAGGARFSVDAIDEVRIGRGDARTATRLGRVLSLEVPDRRMSTEHAKLVARAGGEWHVEDLGSTNGTRVDGQRLSAATIGPASILELGQSFFLLREHDLSRRAPDCDSAQLDAEITGLKTLDPCVATRVERLKRVAQSAVPVMLLGETGTGKEVLARAIHALSKRPGAFVAVNCGALPAALVESQLFGHVKGAFSGAVRDEAGFVRAAHFGTLLLDEIGDLPLPSQAALLRVLQEGEVTPVGSARAAKVDIRVLCATHRPLDALMEAGGFRRDLYARLAGFVHTVPALRDRREDIGLLIADLLRGPRVEGGADLRFRAEAARAIMRHDWPLNVRELEQCLATSSVLAEERIVGVEELPADVAYWAEAPVERAEEATEEPDDALRRELVARLVEARGNVSEVARAMGKARQQIQRWARRFGIDPERYRDG